jgi:hypothetical protein
MRAVFPNRIQKRTGLSQAARREAESRYRSDRAFKGL